MVRLDLERRIVGEVIEVDLNSGAQGGEMITRYPIRERNFSADFEHLRSSVNERMAEVFAMPTLLR